MAWCQSGDGEEEGNDGFHGGWWIGDRVMLLLLLGWSFLPAGLCVCVTRGKRKRAEKQVSLQEKISVHQGSSSQRGGEQPI